MELAGVLSVNWPEAVMVLDVVTVLEVGELVMELVCLHAEAGRFDVLLLKLDVCSQGSALSLEFELLVVVSTISLDLGKGCWVIEGIGHFSQGVVHMAVGVEEVQEPGGHGG